MKFEIDREQMIKLGEWIEIHNNSSCPFSDPMTTGAIGGRMTYSFTNTSLGQLCKAKCACGQEVDLTNYENW